MLASLARVSGSREGDQIGANTKTVPTTVQTSVTPIHNTTSFSSSLL